MPSTIKFRPYLGPDYGKGAIRPLIVGDSFYDKNGNDPTDFAARVIADWARGEQTVPFFTRLGRVLHGVPASDLDREAALSGVAFYNFLQVLAGSFARDKPQSHVYGAAQPAFLEVLTILEPTHVLVTGSDTIKELPPYDWGGETGFPEQHGDKELWVGAYKTPSGFAWTTSIPHASRISAPQWTAAVQSFLVTAPASDANDLATRRGQYGGHTA